MPSKHDQTANRLARRRGVAYNRGPGPDVQTPGMIIEVETERTVPDAGRQLQGFQKSVYVAGATRKAALGALERFKTSTLGVMDPNGNILKRSSRRKSRR